MSSHKNTRRGFRSNLTTTLYASTAILLVVLLTVGLLPLAEAASSWNPTLIVNTESFQTIDEGDGNTNLQIKFGQTLLETLTYDRSNTKFIFSRGLQVNGNLTATGSISAKSNLSGSSLRVDHNADVWGNLTASGTLRVIGATTIGGATKVRADLSGSTLHVDGYTQINGALSASGNIATRGDATINSENGANDATLTFGNSTASQFLKYVNATQNFQLSKKLTVSGSLNVKGFMSGSTLTVDSGVTLHGQAYYFPGNRGSNGQSLTTNGAGVLTWTTPSVGHGSGAAVALHPEYPGATYFSSGATAVGTLKKSFDTTNQENYYEWATSKNAANDYWTAVRVKVPQNFSNWTNSGITMRLRTTSTTAARNYVTLRLYDTGGAFVATTNNASQASNVANTWRTNTINGITGTYTAGGDITMLIKMAGSGANVTDLGTIKLNWSTNTP